MTDPTGAQEGGLSRIPGSVVLKAVQDPDFVLQLLHRDTRDAALSDPKLGLTAAQQDELSSRLDEIARMSFTEAIELLRRENITFS